MLGGKKELLEQIQDFRLQLHELNISISELSSKVNILLDKSKEKSQFPIPDPTPEDPYAKLRNQDGFLSTQEYKRRKAGLKGE